MVCFVTPCLFILYFKQMEEMTKSRGILRSQTESERGTGKENGKESVTESEKEMKGETETDGSRGEKTCHRTTKAKEVTFTSESY